MSVPLDQFVHDLQQTLLADSNVEEQQDFAENVFTRLFCDALCAEGEVGEAEICYFAGRGARGSTIKVNAYAADYENDSLDLIVTIFSGLGVPVRLEKRRVDDAFRAVRGFILAAMDDLQHKMEEAGPAFELAQLLFQMRNASPPLSRLRLFLVTDGIVACDTPPVEDIASLAVRHFVRDVEWLYRTQTSGQSLGAIEIDFTTRPQGAIPCLPMPTKNKEYQSFLMLMSGETLCDIYSEFGPRLLERNVRSFLQAKGGVNKGIRDTLLNEPHRFLAYNNGLTATAQRVAFGSDGHTIERAYDLQIVNGGQTTASIFHAKRLKADLGQVWVQVKLSVVSNPQQLDDFVGKVAQYANSQNKINLADFSANSPFHRAVEKYSRTIWAPAVGNAQNQTRWFYERARGQYADASSRAGTPAKIKAWQAIHPKTQMFTKTDLAKFENTWNQKPHMVSKGAQTNFGEFTVELSARPDFSPSERYFQHLIAKAILFRRAEKIVGDQKFGGYRANIVAYTLAYIFYKTAQRIDLDAVWKRQKVPLSLESTIEKVSHHVYQHITTASGGANVTQFCKQEKCWRLLREKELHLSSELEAELIAVGRAVAAPRPAPDDALSSPSEIDVQNIVDAGQIEADLWFAASKWAARTNNLQGWQRSLLFSIGKLRSSGRDVSVKQAAQGLKAIREVQELGFENILHGLE